LAIRYEYPIWKRTDIAPQVKVGNQKKTATINQVLAALPDEFRRKKQTLAEVRGKLNVSEETIELLIAEMERRGLVEIDTEKTTGNPKIIRRLKTYDEGSA
jgi:DNA-binding MarR family transcriptional regulator